MKAISHSSWDCSMRMPSPVFRRLKRAPMMAISEYQGAMKSE